MADDEQHIRDIQREYLDFLDDEVCRRLMRPSIDVPHQHNPNSL